MMVSPLGQDFAQALRFPASSIGMVVGAYTAAAFVSGLAGALFLDRFDRRSALAVCMMVSSSARRRAAWPRGSTR
jgi:predicted MFS family arabinose efflux permease